MPIYFFVTFFFWHSSAFELFCLCWPSLCRIARSRFRLRRSHQSHLLKSCLDTSGFGKRKEWTLVELRWMFRSRNPGNPVSGGSCLTQRRETAGKKKKERIHRVEKLEKKNRKKSKGFSSTFCWNAWVMLFQSRRDCTPASCLDPPKCYRPPRSAGISLWLPLCFRDSYLGGTAEPVFWMLLIEDKIMEQDVRIDKGERICFKKASVTFLDLSSLRVGRDAQNRVILLVIRSHVTSLRIEFQTSDVNSRCDQRKSCSFINWTSNLK